MSGFSREFKHDVYCESCKGRYKQRRGNFIVRFQLTICDFCGSKDVFVTTETTAWCDEHGCWETTSEHVDQITNFLEWHSQMNDERIGRG